jgi:hypothetical protein
MPPERQPMVMREARHDSRPSQWVLELDGGVKILVDVG